MSDDGAVVVVGGTRAIGLEVVRHYAAAGREVILTGRHPEHVAEAVRSVPGRVRGLTFDLAEPESIAPALADVGPVRYLILAAIDRDANSVRDYDLAAGLRLVTLKLVGYTEVVHTLSPRFDDETAIVLFGGMAKERPYVGSTTVSTVNGGVVGPHPDARGGAPADPRQLHPPRGRRRQPVLGGAAGRGSREYGPDAHQPAGDDAGRRRRRRLPAREPLGERDRALRRRRPEHRHPLIIPAPRGPRGAQLPPVGTSCFSAMHVDASDRQVPSGEQRVRRRVVVTLAEVSVPSR